MADIQLQKPQAGQTSIIAPHAEDRLVLTFDTSDATLTREGDNLEMSFEDGSKLSLTDFYVAFTSENMPTFLIGDAEVGGEQFFAGMDETLMPAAGGTNSPIGGGTITSFAEGTLLTGINRLDGLDQARTTSTDDDQQQFGGFDDDSTVAAITTPIDRTPNIKDDEDLTGNIADAFQDTLTTQDGGERTDSGALEFTLGDGDLEDQTITITLKDGSEHELNFDSNNEATVDTEYGTLTFTRDPSPNADGSYTLGYEFEQTKPYDHSDTTSGSETEGADSFKVTITDPDGDSASTGDIDINIQDDGPIAHTDTDDITEGDAAATGNILDNDDKSVDGTTLTEVTLPDTGMEGWSKVETTGDELAKFESDKGSIVINKDGSYTFTYTDKSLADGVTEDFTFNYTITDGDGDTSSSSLTITATGTDSVPSFTVQGTDLTTDDSALADGVGTESASNIANGSLNYTIGDGEAADQSISIELNGTVYDLTFDSNGEATLTGDYGTFTFTQGNTTNADGSYTLSYSYEQTSAYDKHGDDTSANEQQQAAESFKVIVTDPDGSTVTSDSIDVNIYDDGPQIGYGDEHPADGSYDTAKNADGDYTASGQMDFDFGADGKDSVDVSIGDQFGTARFLTITNEDGSTLLVDISQNGNTITATNSNNGSEAFVFTMNDDGTWDFKQSQPFTGEVKIDVTITDGDGDKAESSLVVKGSDAVPIAKADSTTVDEGDQVTGNILGNDTAGNKADGDSSADAGKELVDVTAPKGWTQLPTTDGELAKFESAAGTITFDKNGDYTFDSNPNTTDEEVSFEFDYSIKDADGDISESTLTIDVTDVTLEHDETGGTVASDDDALNQSIEVTTSLDDGISFDPEAELPTSDYGVFDFDDNGNLTFTQTVPYPHAADTDSVTLEYTFATKDELGNESTATVSVTIADSVPEAKADSDSVTEDGAAATGNILTNDTESTDGTTLTEVTLPDTGMEGWKTPDGWTPTGDELAKFESDKGSIVINNDGSYTFTYTDKSLADGDTEDFTFNYTITDGDGDPSSSSLTITATGTDSVPSFTTQGADLSTDDSALASGVGTESASNIANGSLNYTIGDGEAADQSISIELNGNEYDLTFNSNGEATVNGEYGTFTFTQSTTPNVDGSYTLSYSYEQTSAYDKHGDKTSANEQQEAAESFKVTVTDKDGSATSSDSIDINIYDDGPVVKTAGQEADDSSTAADVVGNIASADIEVDFGADMLSKPDASGETNGAKIELEPSQGATVGLGVEWNGTTWVKGHSWQDGIEVTGSVSEGFTIKLGDVTLTNTPENPNNWNVSYEVSGRDDVTINFTDSDGDKVSHTIAPEGYVNIDMGLSDSKLTVDEANLADGTAPDATELLQTGEIVIEGGVDLKSITIEGTVFTKDSKGDWPGSVDTANGTVQIGSVTTDNDGNTVVSYEYTLKDSIDSGDEASITKEDRSFDMTFTDADGNSDTATIDVTIMDDAPLAKEVETHTTTDTATTYVEIDFGADNEDGKSLTFNDETFTFENGSWTNEEGDTIAPDADGNVVLEAGDMSLSNNGKSDLWEVNVSDVTTDGKEKEITVTDADGDTADIDVSVTRSESEQDNDFAGLLGAASHFDPGTNYNISIVFDTSGSMYHDTYGDIKGDETRLDKACDALIDFVGELYEHAKNASTTGGVVNFQLVTFWGELDVLIDGSKPLTESYNEVISEINELRNLTKNTNDPDFHWGTNYEQGFNAAADWFKSEEIKENGYENQIFLISDGDPTVGDAAKGFNNLNTALKETASGEGEIHAIGVGQGADGTELNKYDSDGKSTVVTDENIDDMFIKVEEGSEKLQTTLSSLGITEQGDDVLIGGIDKTSLKDTLETILGKELSDAELVEFMKNNPDWVLNNLPNSTENDPDILLSGDGDDTVYGQGGDDLVIGDGDIGDVSSLADVAFSTEEEQDKYTETALKDTEMTVEESGALVQNLVDSIQNILNGDDEAAKKMLTDAIKDMEGVNDGNDTIYGGEGDDILLGLGGNDVLFGGGGNDAIFGGSGDDIVVMPNIDDVMHLDGGEGNDILLANVDSADTLKSLLDQNEDSTLDNMEIIMLGDNVEDAKNLRDALANDTSDDKSATLGKWTEGETHEIKGQSYTEYTQDDMTILVNKTMLTETQA